MKHFLKKKKRTFINKNNYFQKVVSNYNIVEKTFLITKKLLSFDNTFYHYYIGIGAVVLYPFNNFFLINWKFFNKTEITQVKIRKSNTILLFKHNLIKFYFYKTWCILIQYWSRKASLSGRVVRRIKGGISIGFGGFLAFMFRRRFFLRSSIKEKIPKFGSFIGKLIKRKKIQYKKTRFKFNLKTLQILHYWKQILFKQKFLWISWRGWRVVFPKKLKISGQLSKKAGFFKNLSRSLIKFTGKQKIVKKKCQFLEYLFLASIAKTKILTYLKKYTLKQYLAISFIMLIKKKNLLFLLWNKTKIISIKNLQTSWNLSGFFHFLVDGSNKFHIKIKLNKKRNKNKIKKYNLILRRIRTNTFSKIFNIKEYNVLKILVMLALYGISLQSNSWKLCSAFTAKFRIHGHKNNFILKKNLEYKNCVFYSPNSSLKKILSFLYFMRISKDNWYNLKQFSLQWYPSLGTVFNIFPEVLKFPIIKTNNFYRGVFQLLKTVQKSFKLLKLLRFNVWSKQYLKIKQSKKKMVLLKFKKKANRRKKLLKKTISLMRKKYTYRWKSTLLLFNFCKNKTKKLNILWKQRFYKIKFKSIITKHLGFWWIYNKKLIFLRKKKKTMRISYTFLKKEQIYSIKQWIKDRLTTYKRWVRKLWFLSLTKRFSFSIVNIRFLLRKKYKKQNRQLLGQIPRYALIARLCTKKWHRGAWVWPQNSFKLLLLKTIIDKTVKLKLY